MERTMYHTVALYNTAQHIRQVRINITVFHQLNGSIKICKKSTLINTTQQQKEKEKGKKSKNLG